MNKYALLCAVVVTAPVLAECDRAERSGRDLAKEVVRSEAEATRSCSSCCKCNSKCDKCGCKSADMGTEGSEESAVEGSGKPEQKAEEGEDDESAETRKCSSCGCSCGKCDCH